MVWDRIAWDMSTAKQQQSTPARSSSAWSIQPGFLAEHRGGLPFLSVTLPSLPQLVSPLFAQPTAGAGPELQLYAELLFMPQVVSNRVDLPGLSDDLVVYCNESWMTAPSSLMCFNIVAWQRCNCEWMRSTDFRLMLSKPKTCLETLELVS